MKELGKKGGIMNIKELAENLGLGEDEYLELIELLIDTGTVDVEKLRSAIEEGNAEEAANAAHSLKGASGSLGLMEIYGLAQKTEKEARNNSLDGLVESVQTLKAQIDSLAEVARR
ncbi:MAG: Hpt domain-containing protein [Deltaproteobacteria bacterium]|nr:Hpt domain-containing protein [Deltaproteobacteria bacterium]